MRPAKTIYFAASILLSALFLYPAAALFFIVICATYWIPWRRLSRVLSNALTGPEPLAADAAPALEPTLITLVSRAPNELLEIGPDAGTSTIVRSFYRQVKDECGDGMRLTKKGRRLTAAKNTMLSRRRKSLQKNARRSGSEAELQRSLVELLQHQPVYEGNAVRILQLSTTIQAKYQVGKEISGDGFTAQGGQIEKAIGRGNCRILLRSRTGRILGEGDQVAFLPGTRFLVVKCSPWQNPTYPEAESGFSFELVELLDHERDIA